MQCGTLWAVHEGAITHARVLFPSGPVAVGHVCGLAAKHGACRLLMWMCWADVMMAVGQGVVSVSRLWVEPFCGSLSVTLYVDVLHADTSSLLEGYVAGPEES